MPLGITIVNARASPYSAAAAASSSPSDPEATVSMSAGTPAG